MTNAFEPVFRQSLSNEIAERIMQLIRSGGHEPGARLPTITSMARDFGVGAPTLREALKKLETVGVVTIRHGSGVYVGRSPDSLLISNPVFESAPSRKLLTDLIEARIPIEVQTAGLAARNGTDEHFRDMDRLLTMAAESLGDPQLLTSVNVDFHRQIALASGNAVMHQIMDVLSTLFCEEQRMILDINGRGTADHTEHVEIYQAVRKRDGALASQLMRQHLERVRDVLSMWEAPLPSRAQ